LPTSKDKHFLRALTDPTKADNYGDLIIGMNPIIENGTRKMVVVFYSESGYDKLVCFKDELIFHYTDSDPSSNYGIVLLDALHQNDA
jgi:hypothetical protein